MNGPIVPADEPLVVFSDGTALLRCDKLTNAERSYFYRYRALSPEQQQEIRNFADYLKRKAAHPPSEKASVNAHAEGLGIDP